MDAKQARNQTERAIMLQEALQMGPINRAIEKASQQGRNCIWVEFLYEASIVALKREGFKVQQESSINPTVNGKFHISW